MNVQHAKGRYHPSGKCRSESIAVHLLACMLARMWSRSEAIAIWAELGSERKKELELTGVADRQDQLAQWDSSARERLQSADEAMKINQTQSMLIFNNVNLPISAMVATDNIIRGAPQSVEHGSILLSISSWHIYPDMVVLQSSSAPISQVDPLINDAGILTIGLNTTPPSETGISWSLPLGHLRHYGGPVVSEKSLVTQGNRIAVTQLIQFIELVAQEPAGGTFYWPGFLAEAVKPLLDWESLDVQIGVRLLSAVLRLLGLDNMNTFTSLLAQPEDSVHYSRDLVKDPVLRFFHNRLIIIRYRKNFEAHELYTTYEYAQREGYKRSYDGQQYIILDPARHCRWIGTDFKEDSWRGPVAEKRFEYFRSQNEDSFAYMKGFTKTASGRMQWTGSREHFSNYGIFHHVTANNDYNSNINPEQETPTSYSDFIDTDPEYYNDVPISRSSGSLDTAALLICKRAVDNEATRSENSPVSRKKPLSYLCELVNTPSWKPLHRSLRALAIVSSIYNQLPSSTIPLSVISQCLPKMVWIPSTGASDGEYSPFTRNMFTTLVKLNRSSTFSCLLFLEIDSLSVPPTALLEVMAMAIDDSIYIAKSLISDPSKKCLAHEICQIKGNIGKSGIALMVPPECPLTRQIYLSNWHSTTLHLGFTDYIFPVDVGNCGNGASNVYFLEPLVSVHDRGEWIADLDILRALEKYVVWTTIERRHWKQPVFSSISECEHVNNPAEESERLSLTSIDNWDEILDPPGGVAIVCSLDNWLGRLATAAVCRQLGNMVMLLPGRFCRLCLRAEWTRLSTAPIPNRIP
ncbi:hypothetical protein F4824DRAFT_489922 [Ustulina deusta]|nr:hypothetical protein F4824DRAFT_489922 [Ustulina deusta]